MLLTLNPVISGNLSYALFIPDCDSLSPSVLFPYRTHLLFINLNAWTSKNLMNQVDHAFCYSYVKFPA